MRLMSDFVYRPNERDPYKGLYYETESGERRPYSEFIERERKLKKRNKPMTINSSNIPSLLRKKGGKMSMPKARSKKPLEHVMDDESFMRLLANRKQPREKSRRKHSEESFGQESFAKGGLTKMMGLLGGMGMPRMSKMPSQAMKLPKIKGVSKLKTPSLSIQKITIAPKGSMKKKGMLPKLMGF